MIVEVGGLRVSRLGRAEVGLYGALAPPLAPTPEVFSEAFSDVAFSLATFSDSPPAEVPPAALSEEPELPSSEELSPLDSLPPVVPDVEPSPVVGLVEVVAVVEVEVVSVASFSAAVLFGGMISGVLLGVASETLLPPHELRPAPASTSRALAASAIRRARRETWLTRQTGS
jgi:hypothetical protein